MSVQTTGARSVSVSELELDALSGCVTGLVMVDNGEASSSGAQWAARSAMVSASRSDTLWGHVKGSMMAAWSSGVQSA